MLLVSESGLGDNLEETSLDIFKSVVLVEMAGVIGGTVEIVMGGVLLGCSLQSQDLSAISTMSLLMHFLPKPIGMLCRL